MNYTMKIMIDLVPNLASNAFDLGKYTSTECIYILTIIKHILK